jgi:hypothetical protein
MFLLSFFFFLIAFLSIGFFYFFYFLYMGRKSPCAEMNGNIVEAKINPPGRKKV